MAKQASLMELWTSFLCFSEVAVTLEPLLRMIVSPDYSPPASQTFFCFWFGDNYMQKSKVVVDICHTQWPFSSSQLHCPVQAGLRMDCAVDLNLLVVTVFSVACPDSLCLYRDSDSFGGRCYLESARLLISLHLGLWGEWLLLLSG